MNYDNVKMMPEFNSNYFAILLQGVSGIFFTFLNHQFIFPVISNLKKATKKRVDKIFIICHI